MEIVFIETPEFVTKFDKIASDVEMLELQYELLKNPFKGDILKGTGGARKIRMKISGRGKRGGARVIYYYVDLQGEIWFLDIYSKSMQSDISEIQKKRLYDFIKETIHGSFE
ncbi:MAG: type II toxin-antitoxin system RelE/ParE family toxin [Calditrichaeota bacterium]|nr:MAG: type II toxin-antitoxin system RelE/ParE family toxin [Calditrichota bacterium]